MCTFFCYHNLVVKWSCVYLRIPLSAAKQLPVAISPLLSSSQLYSPSLLAANKKRINNIPSISCNFSAPSLCRSWGSPKSYSCSWVLHIEHVGKCTVQTARRCDKQESSDDANLSPSRHDVSDLMLRSTTVHHCVTPCPRCRPCRCKATCTTYASDVDVNATVS